MAINPNMMVFIIMANFFFKSRISENILETPQGYLICRNVPIARVGYQEYLGSEIGIQTNEIVDVKRSSGEVFDKKAMTSFENLPFTDEHPEEEVTKENWDKYTKGFVNNIRRGEGKFKNMLIADITVYDEEIIRKILDGKREISCGYTCLYEINADGEYEQTKIRGNHIALVENGRAGELVAIRDAKFKKTQEEKMKKNNKKQFNLFKLWIKDQEPEIIEEIKEELEEVLEEGKEEGIISSDEDLKEKMMEILTDSDILQSIAEKIEEIKSGDAEPDEIQEAEEILEELESAVIEEDEEMSDEEETEDEEAKDEEEEKTTSDAIKFARKQLKNIAKIKDSKIRKQQVKLIMQDINTIMKKNKSKGKNVYAKLNNTKATRDGNFDLVAQLRNKTTEMKNMRRGIK